MSEPTNTEVIKNTIAAIDALQEGQRQAVEAVESLAAHEANGMAHDLANPQSPMHEAIPALPWWVLHWGMPYLVPWSK